MRHDHVQTVLVVCPKRVPKGATQTVVASKEHGDESNKFVVDARVGICM